ncbi:hypothetical protein TSAR_008949 [Trichomalopsis sarcophagae]|uniref:Uncharacterized protein n=1 Tax=Trichomalopsis sarcophagae TaxID=543379 RepID=A0A232FHG0_9HYME|nr:hypothetical protein TSAR_008949 [Trichomalopsis sarcophagae]
MSRRLTRDEKWDLIFQKLFGTAKFVHTARKPFLINLGHTGYTDEKSFLLCWTQKRSDYYLGIMSDSNT